jgi:hypothetical protein
MIEPQIVCPKCSSEIKLTESLAAPLIAEIREKSERQLASKEADFTKRETALRRTHDDLTKAREAIEDEVARKLRSERASIAESRPERRERLSPTI